MKKEYLAPAFTPVNMMIASAANGCDPDVAVASHGFETCVVYLNDISNTVFGGPNKVKGCYYKADMDIGICYYTALPGATVFGS